MSDDENAEKPEDEVISEEDLVSEIEANITEQLEFDKFVTEANVARYRAQTTRLAVLSDFACRQIARIGSWRPDDAADVDLTESSKAKRARDLCLVTVLQAISAIAKQSHVQAERGRKVNEQSVPQEDDDEPKISAPF